MQKRNLPLWSFEYCAPTWVHTLISLLAPREATPDRNIVSSTRLCHVPQMRITNASWMKLQCGIFSVRHCNLVQTFHSQEWLISNFPCSFTRSNTWHSMKNLAFHRLLRWKMIILSILTTSLLFELGIERVNEIVRFCTPRSGYWMFTQEHSTSCWKNILNSVLSGSQPPHFCHMSEQVFPDIAGLGDAWQMTGTEAECVKFRILSRVQASCMWTCGFLPWSPLFFRFTCEYHNVAPGKPRGRWTQYKLPREEWMSRWADVKKPRDIFYLLDLGQSRVMAKLSEIKTSSFSPECIQCWNSLLISHHDCASLGYSFACTTNIRYR